MSRKAYLIERFREEYIKSLNEEYDEDYYPSDEETLQDKDIDDWDQEELDGRVD